MIIGPSGVGKSQLACLLSKHASEFDLVRWLRSHHRSVLAECSRGDYEAIAGALGLDAGGRDVRVAVDSWLANNSRWILVFDDVTAVSGVRDFLPAVVGAPKARRADVRR